MSPRHDITIHTQELLVVALDNAVPNDLAIHSCSKSEDPADLSVFLGAGAQVAGKRPGILEADHVR